MFCFLVYRVLKWHIEMTHALFMECIFQSVKSGPFTPHFHAGFATLKLLALESQVLVKIALLNG